MSDLFERMLVSYRLTSSTSNHMDALRRTCRARSAAESQNWRCAYCGVKMFAGVPAEDIFAYASEMMIPLKKAGIWWPKSFQALFWLRATEEHLIGRKYKDVFGAEIHRNDNVVAACRYCNSQRNEAGNKSVVEWSKEVERRITAKEHPLYRIILNHRRKSRGGLR